MTHHSKSLMAENIMHYILKLEFPEIMLIMAIIGLFLTFFPNISVKFFCKGSWLVCNNITYTEIWQNCSEHKAPYKCFSNFYYFSSSITLIFVNRVFFGHFFNLWKVAFFTYVMWNTSIKYVLINGNHLAMA